MSEALTTWIQKAFPLIKDQVEVRYIYEIQVWDNTTEDFVIDYCPSSLEPLDKALRPVMRDALKKWNKDLYDKVERTIASRLKKPKAGEDFDLTLPQRFRAHRIIFMLYKDISSNLEMIEHYMMIELAKMDLKDWGDHNLGPYIDEFQGKIDRCPIDMKDDIIYGHIHPQFTVCERLKLEMALWGKRIKEKPEEKTSENLIQMARDLIEREEQIVKIRYEMTHAGDDEALDRVKARDKERAQSEPAGSRKRANSTRRRRQVPNWMSDYTCWVCGGKRHMSRECTDEKAIRKAVQNGWQRPGQSKRDGGAKVGSKGKDQSKSAAAGQKGGAGNAEGRITKADFDSFQGTYPRDYKTEEGK